MTPLQITFRTIPPTDAIENYIKKNFNRITKINHKILSTRVVVDVSQKHKHKGKLFNVSIDSTLPGKEIVSRKQSEDLYAAIKHAFTAIETQYKKI